MSQKKVNILTLRRGGSLKTRRGGRGKRVYNIHQPARQLRQGAITRNESIRRLENEYAEQLRVHQIKQQEKEAKKRAEKLARYKYVDQGNRLTEGYLDEAVGGQAYIESEEEVRQRQQEQWRRDALVFQEQERKKIEERKKREEEKKKQELEKYKHVSSGQRLGGSRTEAYIESEEEVRQRQQEQWRRDALVFQEQERKKIEERKKREEEKKKQELEKYKHVSSGQRLGGSRTEVNPDMSAVNIEAEEEIRQHQLDQLRRDSLAHQQLDTQKNEETIRREEQKKQELEKCKQVSSGQRLGDNNHEGSSENGGKKQMDNSSQEPEPADITTLFVKFLNLKKKLSIEETGEMLSEFQLFMAAAKKTPDKQAISLQPAHIENPASSDSQVLFKKPASCTLPSISEGPVLVIRPTQEALDRTMSQCLMVQDMDKHGQSLLYKPQIEQTPTFFNNKFQWKQPEFSNRHEQHSLTEPSCNRVDQQIPQSKMVETQNVLKSLDEIAKSTGAIPKQKPVLQHWLRRMRVFQDSHSRDCSSSLSNEPACSEVTEIDLKEEMKAARLRMQKQYEESLRKRQDNGVGDQ